MESGGPGRWERKIGGGLSLPGLAKGAEPSPPRLVGPQIIIVAAILIIFVPQINSFVFEEYRSIGT